MKTLVATIRIWLNNRTVVNLAGALILAVVFALIAPSFLTLPNFVSLVGSITIMWIVALGLTFVLLTGGFDLSVGSTLALSGIALGWLFNVIGVPMWMAIILTIIFGALLGGGINGLLIGRLGASFMIVTLGTLTLFRGLVNLTSGTQTTSVASPLLDTIVYGRIVGVPISVFVLLITLIIAWYVLRHTYFGRDVYAVGGNAEAARLAGVNVARTLILVYAIAGAAAAFGGALQVGRLGAASPLVGESIMFDAAAAVLLGGTSLRGGYGGVVGTAVGVLFLGVLSNGLAVSGVPSFWQQIVTGFILATAAVADQVQNGGLRFTRYRRRRSENLKANKA